MIDQDFKTMVMEQLLGIRKDIGNLKGRSIVWGGLAGAIMAFILRRLSQ